MIATAKVKVWKVVGIKGYEQNKVQEKTLIHNKSVFWERWQSESTQVESWEIAPGTSNTTPTSIPLELSCDITAPAYEAAMN